MFFKKIKQELSDLRKDITLIIEYTFKTNQEMVDIKGIREAVRWNIDNKVYLENHINGIIENQQSTIAKQQKNYRDTYECFV